MGVSMILSYINTMRFDHTHLPSSSLAPLCWSSSFQIFPSLFLCCCCFLNLDSTYKRKYGISCLKAPVLFHFIWYSDSSTVGSQANPRLSHRPWWKDKGNTSSMSLPRGRLGWVSAEAGASKDLKFQFLGPNFSPTEETGIISLKASEHSEIQLNILCSLYNIGWLASCWLHPTVWWLSVYSAFYLLQTVYKMLHFLISLLLQDIMTPVFLFSLLPLIPWLSLSNPSLKNDTLVQVNPLFCKGHNFVLNV